MLVDVKYVSFLTELLTKINPFLSEDDIYVLNKLNTKYPVRSIAQDVCNKQMNEIISNLILDAIPYRFAKNYIGMGRFVSYVDNTIKSIVPDDRAGWYEIQCVVNDMNNLIKDED